MKYRLKDSIKIYLIVFIATFSIFSIVYINYQGIKPQMDYNNCLIHNPIEKC